MFLEFDKESYNVIFDMMQEIHYPDEVYFSDSDLKFIFDNLDFHIKADILKWGINDTVVRELIFESLGGYKNKKV